MLPASAFSWDSHTLTINYDGISSLGLLSVQWDSKALIRGTDFSVYQHSVIVRIDEDYIAAQSPREHNCKGGVPKNYTGETTVTVGDTHNSNAGSYAYGYMGATDSTSTGNKRKLF